MTIDEAIKELETQKSTAHRLGYAKAAQAHQLGIEALERLEVCRSKGEIYSVKLLPGETLD